MIIHSKYATTALDGPAAVHMDRIVRDCLDRRQSAEVIERRVSVAAAIVARLWGAGS